MSQFFWHSLAQKPRQPCNQQTSSLPMSATRVPLLHLLLVHRRHQTSSRQAQAFQACAKIPNIFQACAHALKSSTESPESQFGLKNHDLRIFDMFKMSQDPVCGWHHRTSWRPNHWDASQVRVVTERERAVIATVSPSCPAAKWSLSKGSPQGTPVGIKADLDALWLYTDCNVNNRPLQPHEFSSIASLWSTKWLRNDRPTSTWFFWHCSNNASWSSPQKNNDFWKRTAKWMRYTCNILWSMKSSPIS